MKILIIEDDTNKSSAISEFLSKKEIGKCTIKESYHGGIKELSEKGYDVVLLDMTMPVFDNSAYGNSGRPLPLAGRDLLFMVRRKKIHGHFIIITQYEDFNGMSLKALEDDLKANFPGLYHGIVYYNVMNNKWKAELLGLLSTIKQEKGTTDENISS